MTDIDPNLIRYVLRTTEEKTAKLPEHKLSHYGKINGKITVLWGLRGAGKTTLLLQHLKENGGIYLKLDHFLFSVYRLYDIVAYFNKSNNITRFYIDEIHTYKTWFQELKDIYDDLPVEIVASGSSAIALSEGESYLGRRSAFIHTEPLKFSDYLAIKYRKEIPLLTMKDILDKPHENLAQIEAKIPSVWADFQDYLIRGGLPIVFSQDFSNTTYVQIINRIITDDILYMDLGKEAILNLKKVVPFLATSPPGELKMESISRLSGVTKSTIYTMVDALQKAGLIKLIYPTTSTASDIMKRQPKVYFSHPALRTAITDDLGAERNIGAVREEFFYNAVNGAGYDAAYLKGEKKIPDFLIDGKLFEIGGKYKKKKGYPLNTIIVSDSSDTRYPLMLFGFLKK